MLLFVMVNLRSDHHGPIVQVVHVNGGRGRCHNATSRMELDDDRFELVVCVLIGECNAYLIVLGTFEIHGIN